jgi:hypothetical protein
MPPPRRRGSSVPGGRPASPKRRLNPKPRRLTAAALLGAKNQGGPPARKTAKAFSLAGRSPYTGGKIQKMFIYSGKRYLLPCQIKEKTVYSEYVVDCRQDYGRRPP